MTPDDPRHGTNAGYIQHCLQKIPSCNPCRNAHAAYKRGLHERRHANKLNGLHIDPTGTRRRIQALIRMGWRYQDMDAWLGYRSANTHNLNRGDTAAIHFDTAEAVKRMYDALSMRLGPSQRNRLVSASRGWAPPLAWDDDQIDDPSARPLGMPTTADQPAVIDEARIERRINGDRTVRLHKGEAEQVIRRMLADGRTTHQIHKLTGIKVERYVRVRQQVAA